MKKLQGIKRRDFMDQKALIQKAIDTLPFSYAPDSNCKVGAALRTRDGKI